MVIRLDAAISEPHWGRRNRRTSWRYRGWRVVIACFTIAMFAWDFVFYGHRVFLAELKRTRGWPAALISGATTLYYFIGALAARAGFTGECRLLYQLSCVPLSCVVLDIGPPSPRPPKGESRRFRRL